MHVSYGASWLDFPVGRASASQGGSTPTSIDFDFDVNYDNGGGTNTIRKVVGKLMYPAQDSPCFAGDCQGRLDLEAHNQDDEGPSSTAPAENSGYDSRDSNCDNEKHCVELTLSSYIFTDSEADSTYGDGPWTMNVLNNETYEQQVDRFYVAFDLQVKPRDSTTFRNQNRTLSYRLFQIGVVCRRDAKE